MKILFACLRVCLLWCLFVPYAYAQPSIEATIPTPNFLYQCADSSLFTVRITNSTASVITNLSLAITHPANIVKVGSVTATKGASTLAVIDPVSNNNNSNVSFALTSGVSLAPDDSLVVEYWVKALCGTANLSYTNQITFNYTESGVNKNVVETTLAYTVQIPFLELDNAGTASTTVSCAGETFSQVVTVSNQGNFNSLMDFLDIEIDHPASVAITGTTKGTITTIGGKTTVRLTGADFLSVGNNDDVLDFDEQISVTITGTLTDCILTDKIVTFQPVYRCSMSDAAVCRRVPETIAHTLHSTGAEALPTLTATTSCALNSSASALQITNTGAIVSQFVRLNLTIPNTCDCQAIDFSTLQASLNGGAPFALTVVGSSPTGSACLSGNPSHVRTVSVNLPNLNPADVLQISWNAPLCGGASCANASIYWQYDLVYVSACCPNATVNLGTGVCTVMPQLSATLNPSCVHGSKTLTITNVGNKDATDIDIQLFTGVSHASGIVSGSVTTSTGALSFVGSNNANACGNPALLRSVDYTLDVIPAGGSATITWTTAGCEPFQSCTAYNSEDYGYQIQFEQSCATGTLTLNGNRTTNEDSQITDTDNNLITTRTCPTDNSYTLPLRISGTSLTYAQRYAEIVIDLPANFTWNGNMTNLLLNGVTAPISANTVGNQLIIRYALPITGLPATISPTFDINCVLACDGVQAIRYVLNTYNDCGGNNARLHTCNGTQYLDIDSTSPVCASPDGLGCLSPAPQPTQTTRLSFGYDDGDNNRYADGNNTNQSLRLNKLLMYKDTMRTVYSGTISSSPNTDTLVTNIVLYHPSGAAYNYLTLLDLDFTLTDASSGITYNLGNAHLCPNIFSIRDTLNSRIYTLAFTESAINACYSNILPANFAFEAGDVVSYAMQHRIDGNIGLGNPRTLQVRTDMYLVNQTNLWPDPLPIFPGCPNVPMDSVQVVGYRYQVTSQQTQGDICHDMIALTLSHNFDIQQTGNQNIFTYEDRRWVRFKQIKITLPTGVQCNPATSTWLAQPFNLPLPVPPYTQSGNTITFDLITNTSNYYTSNAISSDDGVKLDFTLLLATLCNAQASNTVLAQYTYDSNLPLIQDLPTQASFTVQTNVPAISYSVNATPTSCTGTQATWSFSISNSNTSLTNPASPYYNWLYLEFPAGSSFTNPVLVENGVTTIPKDAASGFYLIGDIAKGTTRTYTLTVDYPNNSNASCYNNAFKMFYDWSCAPINNNFTSSTFKQGYTCSYDSTQLGFVAGANTVLIDVLNTSYNTVRVCEENTYKARVRNVGQNNLRKIKVTVTPPTGFNFISNSFTYTYGASVDVPFTNGSIIIQDFAVDTFFDIAFKYNTTCLDDLVGNAQFLIDVDVETCCQGDDLAAYPLPALDVSQIYSGDHRFSIALNNTPNITCTNKNTVFSITLSNTGGITSDASDFVMVTLPTGLAYVANSITSNGGAINDMDMTITGNQITWKIDPSGASPVAAGASRLFTIELTDTLTIPSCSNYAVRVQTFMQGIVACSNIGLTCTRTRFTGTRTRRIRVLNTNLAITNFQQLSYAIPATGQLASGIISLHNNGPNSIAAGTTFNVYVYFDNVFSTIIPVTLPSQLSIGGTYNYTYNNIPCSVCDVKVTLPVTNPNCICKASQDSIWTGIPLSAGLDVRLRARFNAKTGKTELAWTVPQIGAKRFIIERSRQAGEFQPIQYIDAQDNSLSYTYQDNLQAYGWHYYRVKAVWQNGDITKSNAEAVDIPLQDVDISVSPNPFDKDMRVLFNKPLVGEVSIQLLDASGKVVFEEEADLAGDTLYLPAVTLPKGVYILRVQHYTHIWTKTVVKK